MTTMTHTEARDIFTNETSWSHGSFEEQCALHEIEPLEGEWFGQTAGRLWDALTEDERESFAVEFTEYYAA